MTVIEEEPESASNGEEESANAITKEENQEVNEIEANSEGPPKSPWYKFGGVKISQGYNVLGLGRGALVMSNIFLSSSFIYLASEQAGCLDEEGDVMEDCNEKVYGFKPASFVTNIAVISGVLSALFMPLVGAMIDYTSYRKAVGVGSAVVMVMIQAAQIGTVSATWLAMAVLQALAGFLYQVQVLAVYAYLPDMAYILGEHTMTKHTATFVMTQFGSQSTFLIVVIALSFALGLDDVVTAQMSQGINCLWSGTFLWLGWRLMNKVPANNQLPEGHSLLTEGFVKVYNTAKNINRIYKRGLRWFFLALIFAEAGANAFTIVAVVFLDEQIGMSSTEIGLFFLTTLLSTIPGSLLGSRVTERLDPKRSWQWSMVCLMLWAACGALVVDVTPKAVVYPWGAGIGVFLGWFYPTESLFFSMCLPKGQEAELSGFFVYCTQILGWLPPLIFTLMVEANISQTYGVIVVNAFFPIAILLLMCAAPWDEILEESCRRGGDQRGGKDVETTEGGNDAVVAEEVKDAAQ